MLKRRNGACLCDPSLIVFIKRSRCDKINFVKRAKLHPFFKLFDDGRDFMTQKQAIREKNLGPIMHESSISLPKQLFINMIVGRL